MEADTSIWRKPGHFYFALTEVAVQAVRRKKKVLDIFLYGNVIYGVWRERQRHRTLSTR